MVFCVITLVCTNSWCPSIFLYFVCFLCILCFSFLHFFSYLYFCTFLFYFFVPSYFCTFVFMYFCTWSFCWTVTMNFLAKYGFCSSKDGRVMSTFVHMYCFNLYCFNLFGLSKWTSMKNLESVAQIMCELWSIYYSVMSSRKPQVSIKDQSWEFWIQFFLDGRTDGPTDRVTYISAGSR